MAVETSPQEARQMTLPVRNRILRIDQQNSLKVARLEGQRPPDSLIAVKDAAVVQQVSGSQQARTMDCQFAGPLHQLLLEDPPDFVDSRQSRARRSQVVATGQLR